jgi:hypothetical protein
MRTAPPRRSEPLLQHVLGDAAWGRLAPALRRPTAPNFRLRGNFVLSGSALEIDTRRVMTEAESL